MKYIIIFAITGFLFSCTPNKPTENSHPHKLPVITLQENSVTLYAEFLARLEDKVNVYIRSQVDGYICNIFVEEGAYDKKLESTSVLFKIKIVIKKTFKKFLAERIKMTYKF